MRPTSFDVAALDDGSPPARKVSEVPDGDVIVIWKVSLHLTGQEAVHLHLVLELGGELSSCHLDRLVGPWLLLDGVDLVGIHLASNYNFHQTKSQLNCGKWC